MTCNSLQPVISPHFQDYLVTFFSLSSLLVTFFSPFFRSFGVISGLTGDGNVGAVLTPLMFVKGSSTQKETGITLMAKFILPTQVGLMGIMIICCTFPMTDTLPTMGWNVFRSIRKGCNGSKKTATFLNGAQRRRRSVKFAENKRSERKSRIVKL